MLSHISPVPRVIDFKLSFKRSGTAGYSENLGNAWWACKPKILEKLCRIVGRR